VEEEAEEGRTTDDIVEVSRELLLLAA